MVAKTNSQRASAPMRQDEWDDAPVAVIEPLRGWQVVNLGEIWRYRELLYFVTWRDVKVRYKQTAIGAVWAVLQPFLTMVAFSVIFGRLMHVETGGVPYPVFSYSALLPWTFFASSLSRAGNSMVHDANLISKVYFPRLILPMAAVVSMLLDFAIAFIILLAMMAYYHIPFTREIVWLPFFLLLAFMTALGVGLWLAALNVRYRDITYVIPFMVQFWLFITPVAYSSAIVPEQWRTLYALNPMVGVVEGFRWALLGSEDPPGRMVLLSAAVVALVFLGGLLYFRRAEDEFADVV